MCGEKTLILSYMETITLENGEKAIKLWYGAIETVSELKANRAELSAKLATAEGWDIPFTRTALSSTEFKLRKLGEIL